MEKKITRIRTDNAGDSYFDDSTFIPLTDNGPIGNISNLIPTSGMMIRYTPPDYDFDWHNAPRKQFVIMIDGSVEITTSRENESRIFVTGDIITVEDTDGVGHYSQCPDEKGRWSIFVPFPESDPF